MKKTGSKNLNTSEERLVIQCPECHTKFSINRTKVSSFTSSLQFHCSKCDNLFSANIEDLKVLGNKTTKMVNATNKKITNTKEKENTEEQETALKNQDNELQNKDYYLGNKEESSKDLNEFVINENDSPQKDINITKDNQDDNEDRFFEDVKKDDNARYGRKSAFLRNNKYSNTAQNIDTSKPNLKTTSYQSQQKDNNYEINDNSEFNSWLNQNANEFSNSLLSNENIDENSTQEYDLLSYPKKKLHSMDEYQSKSYEFNNKKDNKIGHLTEKNIQKKIRSWNAVFKLSLPFIIFLIILTCFGFYLQNNREVFQKMDLAIFKTGKTPPAGLFLKNVRIASKTLNNGENIKLVTGRVLNDSDKVIDDILLESFLFDDNNNIVSSKKIKANSQLGMYKMHELLSLESDIIEKLQNSKIHKKQRLAPGEQVRFAIAFTNSKNLKNITKYATRIYSVD